MFEYFYGNEIEQYLFYRVPQLLFTDEKFVKISCEAKLLYGFLLDRCGLSKKNKWYDDNGRIYVFFKQEEVCEKLNIGAGKAVKIFSELENIGLICRKKQGQGKPTKIYVLNFAKEVADNKNDGSGHEMQTSAENNETEVQTSENRKSETSTVAEFAENNETEVKTSENRKSKLAEIESQDFRKSKVPIYSHTEINHTEISHTNHQSINQGSKTENRKSEIYGLTTDEKRKFIKRKINYDDLKNSIDGNILDLIVDIMLEAYNPKIAFITIQKQPKTRSDVQSQYELLTREHIEYVIQCFREVSQKSQIKHIRPYLTTCLYNAPQAMDLYKQTKSMMAEQKSSSFSYDDIPSVIDMMDDDED